MNLTGKHYGIIVFCLATAFLHLSLLPNTGPRSNCPERLWVSCLAWGVLSADSIFPTET